MLKNRAPTRLALEEIVTSVASRSMRWLEKQGDLRSNAEDDPAENADNDSPWNQRVFDIDPLECSSCGGRMRFVEVIEDVGRARSELRRTRASRRRSELRRARARGAHR